MKINFTPKEIEVIENVLNPGKTAEDTCNAVLRSWFDVSVNRMQVQQKPTVQMLDALIAAHRVK